VDAAEDFISLDEVRSTLATIRGSLSEAVIEERREIVSAALLPGHQCLAKLYRKELGSDLVTECSSKLGVRTPSALVP